MSSRLFCQANSITDLRVVLCRFKRLQDKSTQAARLAAVRIGAMKHEIGEIKKVMQQKKSKTETGKAAKAEIKESTETGPKCAAKQTADSSDPVEQVPSSNNAANAETKGNTKSVTKSAEIRTADSNNAVARTDMSKASNTSTSTATAADTQ